MAIAKTAYKSVSYLTETGCKQRYAETIGELLKEAKMRKIDPTLVKSFISGAVTGLLGFMVAVMGPLASTQALSISTPHDCDDNAVIRCGADTTTDMHHKYNQSPSAQAIYAHFGITDWNMANLTNNAVVGTVTKGGSVLVGGKEVATGAMTAGRMNISGSTAVTSGGVTFFKRPPSVSFQQQSLPSFVVLNSNGEFKFAIIASCGNPVTATPTQKPTPPAPTPQPKPTPPAAAPTQPAPAATPAVVNTNINNNTVNVQQQQQQQAPQPAPPAPTPPPQQAQTQTQPPQTQTQTQSAPPAPAPAPAPVVVAPAATQPVSLPKTGLSDGLYIAILAAIGGSAAHQLFVRRKLRQQL